jgi:hypothetical protein
MTEAAYFIQSLALKLPYTARRFPKTAQTALAWMARAEIWAQKRDYTELAERVRAGITKIEQGNKEETA